MEALPHVLQKVLDIIDEEENQSFAKLMKYRRYGNVTDICAMFYHIQDTIHGYSEFRVDDLRSALKFSTTNKIRMFTSWMGTKMIDGFLELYTVDLLSLTRE